MGKKMWKIIQFWTIGWLVSISIFCRLIKTGKWLKYSKLDYLVVLENILNQERQDIEIVFGWISFLAEGLQCYACSSDKLEECATLHSTEELPIELCPSDDDASCFTRIEGGLSMPLNLSSQICYSFLFLSIKSQFNHSHNLSMTTSIVC